MFKTLDVSNYKAGRMPATALFNRLNGSFFNVVGMPIDNLEYDKDHLIARSVEFDFTEDGDYIEGGLIIDEAGNATDDFVVKPRSERPITIYEDVLNQQAEEKITKKYPIAEQVTILSNATFKLGEQAGVQDTDEFKALHEMLDYIKTCITTNQAKKAFYAADKNTVYITDEEAAAIESRRYEGGLHEALGPRDIEGGRVFGSGRTRGR